MSTAPRRTHAAARLLAAAALAFAVLAPRAQAETNPAADTGAAAGSRFGYALAHELMSPYCPGRTLSACPSEQAAELRQWILLQEAAGASREEVVAMLEERFGDEIRSAPEAEGWGLAAWLWPGAALLVGALVAARVLRRMVAPARATAPHAIAGTTAALAATAAGDAELERLVDAELAAGDR